MPLFGQIFGFICNSKLFFPILSDDKLEKNFIAFLSKKLFGSLTGSHCFVHGCHPHFKMQFILTTLLNRGF